MGLFDYFRANREATSASIARERLNILIAHERVQRNQPSYLPALQHDLLEVIRRYVDINDDDLKLVVDRDDECEVLEMNITLPEEAVT